MTFTQQTIDRYQSDCARFAIEEAEEDTWLLVELPAPTDQAQVAHGPFASPFAAMDEARTR